MKPPEAKISKLAYSIFGSKLKAEKSKYAKLDRLLKAARIPKTYDYYLAEAKLYSIISAVFGAVTGMIVYPFIRPQLMKVFTNVYKPEVPYSLPISLPSSPKITINLGNVGNYILMALVILIFTALFYYLVYGLFLLYPSIKVDERKREIERMLPYAVNYMFALSRGGVSILDIIYSLANHEETYGEVAREFQFVVDHIEFFGMDLHAAMMELYDVTPSPTLKELISGLLTTIDSGGDISVFLAGKSEQYAEKARVEQKGFLDTLALLAEAYVTAAVATPLFLFIIESIMLAMGSGDISTMYALAYIMVPLGSISFAGLIYFITPKGTERVAILEVEEESIEPTEEVKESELYRRFVRAMKRKKSLQLLKAPLRVIREKPIYSLVFSIPAALIYLILAIHTIRPEFAIVIAIIIALAPLSFFHEIKKRWMNRIKEQIPEFLKDLAGICATGATLQQAIEIVAETGKGGIYDEVKKMQKDVEWGAGLVEAFAKFSNRLKVPALTRVVVVLMDVLRIGGDLTEALHLCARDAELERTLAKERKVSMLIYVIIIYIAFFAFLGIMYMLFTKFFPSMFKSSGGIFKRTVSKDELIWVMSQATLFQGLFSGIVAGVMGEGDPLSGIKHSIIMLIVTLGVLISVI